MKPDAADHSVPREISGLFSNQRLILRETQRAVTPLGGVTVFVAFLHKLGFVEKVRQHMPIQWRSPNHIDPTATFTAFLIAVLAGARRFAHANWLRGDRALHAVLGLSRFPIDDTIRNLFRRFGMEDVLPGSMGRSSQMLSHKALEYRNGQCCPRALNGPHDFQQQVLLYSEKLVEVRGRDVGKNLDVE